MLDSIGAGKKALIAMSGGVDSSVAALFMKERGYECAGVTMRLFDNEDICEAPSKTCCSLEDAEDARRVAAEIGIPFYIFDFSADFREQVIERFCRSYLAGITPNPCIDCNRYIKYDRLYRRMDLMGFDCVVTGHYARIHRDEVSGRYLLLAAGDKTKDQSYVLYMLSQDQLAHTVFPLGDRKKEEIRRIAGKHGFVNAHKRDSQDICFVRDGDYAKFIANYLLDKPGIEQGGAEKSGAEAPAGMRPGNFVDRDGTLLGGHEGIVHYTIGQRKGLGRAFGKPVYVTEIRPDTNEVVLGEDADLFSERVTIYDINLISVADDGLAEPMRVTAKIRYNQPPMPATAVRTGTDRIEIRFDEPQRAVTRGQAAVLYDGEIVVGGGTIL
ncbi:MAG: tRNA 2-thiouridine(34) synthase MnmA [Clostridiales Family XIII bacterium]|jgi:tRNA-specific 2-thiouridylase|nr:tRNA 2-thiouridine(34) synthase MnmA [Clostridiales Family XIII bacterium]